MKDLHLATSINHLNELAQKNFKNMKPDKLYYNSAEKLFKTGLRKQHEGDEETAYVLYFRFILVYEFLENKSIDKFYTKSLLGSEYRTATSEIDNLKISLHNRYLEVEQQKLLNVDKMRDDSPKVVEKPEPPGLKYPSGYITCSDLYGLIQKKMDVILFDTRPTTDYLKSRMKHLNTVNIPDEIIQTGKSANILGKEVPNDSKDHWDRRWKTELLIIFDWSSTKETITASKVSMLKEILVQWDTTMSNNQQPVILSGGYLEWLQTYPMLCTNPDILYQVQNVVLNDLLDLDTIEYPAAEEATRYLRPPSLQPVVNRATKPNYQPSLQLDNQLSNINDNKEVDIKQIEYDPDQDQDLQETEEDFPREVPQPQRDLKPDEKISEKKNKPDVNKENEEIRKKLQNQNIDDLKAPLNNVVGDSVLRKDIDIREKLLQEAREKKKNLSFIDSNFKNVADIKKMSEIFPTIDRNSKPTITTMKGMIVSPGYTGLKNLGATCYMNSVIQVYSNTRMLHNFFLLDANSRSSINGPVSKPFQSLLLKLWSGQYKYFTPTHFKSVVNEYGHRYRSREHQDAQEFLCSLNSWLHDDLKNDIVRALQCVWTPKEEAWIEETGGKISIIQNTFMGQHSNIIDCESCQNKLRKYEIFQTLALALPAFDCTLQECLQLYAKRQQIDGYKCNKCKSSKRVFISHYYASLPTNLVVTLKRFQMIKNKDGYITFEKNSIGVKYPIENLNIAGINYHLYGIIVHRGTLDSGHYFAVVRNVRTGCWLMYDDNNVYPVEKENVVEPNNAYILFYNREDEEEKARHQFQS